MAANLATRRRAAWLATSALVMFAAPAAAQDLPTGGSVAAGQATIQSGANSVVVRQTSDRAVVNWDSFGIGQGGRVSFEQPNAGSAILNRVTGADISRIAGTLDSNGQVFLLNRNGIIITPTGTVDTRGGFVASTLNIRDEDFLAGNLIFEGGGGSIVNQGNILTGRHAAVALIGGRVANEGIITAPLGRVMLASGSAATLDLSGRGYLQVAVPADMAGDEALLSNSGSILAEGGTVVLKAATAKAIVRRVVNLSGVIEAKSVSGSDGAVLLDGGAGGTTEVSGRIDVSGAQGGRIDITGGDVKLTGATLDASGTARGGLVRVGGEFQGGNTTEATKASEIERFAGRYADAGDLASAQRVATDATSVIDVSGGADGGSAILWSDLVTDQRGTIRAGGARGGAVEVSSKGRLITALDRIETGFGGILLLDPKDIFVAADNLFPAPFTESAFETGYADNSGNTSTFAVGTIRTMLEAGTDVILRASNDISWNANLSIGLGITSPGNLTLRAGRSIMVGAFMTMSNSNLTLVANDSLANGVVDADRDAGNAVIDTFNGNLSGGVGSASTGGHISLTVSDGAGLTNRAVGNSRLGALDGTSLTVNPGTGTMQIFAPGGGVGEVTWRGREGVTLTGNLNISTGGGLVVTGQTVNWTNESTATIRSNQAGGAPVKFVENNVTTRLGLVGNGVAGATRLALGASGAAPHFTKTYGDADPTFTPLNIVSGTMHGSDTLATLLAGGSLSVAGGTTTTTTPGDYTVTTSATGSFAFANTDLNGTRGYFIDLRSRANTLRITPKVLTPTVTNGSYVYGSPASVVSLAGVINGDTVAPVVSWSAGANQTLGANGGGFGFGDRTAAGSSTFTLASLAGANAANYSLDLSGTIAGSLAISQKAITYTSFDATSVYGTAPTPLVTLDGVLGGDTVTPGTLLGTRSGTTAALTGATGVGAYAISINALSGAAAGNYSVASSGNTLGTQTITAKPITFSVANANSTYGTLAVVPSSSLVGLVNGDSVTGTVQVRQSGNPVTLAERSNAGSYELTVSALAGTGAGNYSIAGAGNTNGTLTISPKALGLTITGATHTYGTPTSIASLSGILSGDDVRPRVRIGGLDYILTAVDGGFGVDERLTVGNRTFTVDGLNGAAAANYSVTTGGTGALNINARPITYAIANVGSTYGDLAAPTGALTGVLSGDTVSASVNVSQSGNPVTLAARTAVGAYALAAGALSGAQAGNYVIAGVGNTNGTLTIAPRTVTYSVGNTTSTYGSAATLGTATLNNVAAGDTLTSTVGVTQGGNSVTLTDRSNAGSYSVQVTGIAGAAVSNYVLASSGNTAGTLTINPKSLTYSVANATSTYGNSTHTPGAVTFTGLLSGDSVTANYRIRAGDFDVTPTALYGASTLSVSVNGLGGASAGNYVIAGAGNTNGTLTIARRAINYVVPNSSSVYGNAANLGTAALIGVVNNDAVFMQSGLVPSSGIGFINNRDNAGTYTIVPFNTVLAGAHAQNYVIATTGNVDGTHTRAPRTLTGSITLSTAAAGALGGSITYGSAKSADITGTFNLTQFQNGSVLSGDTVTATVAAPAFKTSAAGYLAVGSYVFTGGTLSGASASNYVLAPTSRTLTVDPKSLGFNLTSATSTYGTLANIGTATATGLLAGDAVAGGTFSAIRRGSSTPSAITATTAAGIYDLSVATLTGADAANYVGGSANATLTINPKALTYTIGSASSTYGTVATPGAVTLSGVVGTDAVQGVATVAGGLTVRTAAGTYAQILQGLTGAAAGNYVVATTGNTAGTLTVARKPLSYTVSSTDIAGTYGIAPTVPIISLQGVVNGDFITVPIATTNVRGGGVSELYDYTDVGTYSLSLQRRNGEYALSGFGVGNYILADDGKASIATFTQSPFTIGYRVTGGTSVYGSTIQPTITVTGIPEFFAPGLRPELAVTVTNAAGATIGYGATTPVGSYTTNVALVGRGAGNFAIAATGNSGAALTITPRPLTVTATPGTATYGDVGSRTLFTLANAVAGDDVGLAIGGTSPALTAAANGTTRSYSVAIPKAATAYTYTVTGLSGGAMANYTLTGGAGATSGLTVAQKAITYSVAAVTGQYGARTTLGVASGSIFGDPGFTTGAVTLTGVVAGDTLTPTVRLVALGGELLTHGERTPVGTYFQVVTGVTGAAAANYKLAEVGNTANTMTINKAKLTYTVSEGGRIYSNGTSITTGTPGIVTLNRGVSLVNGTVVQNSPIIAGDQVSTGVIVKTVAGGATTEPLAPGFYRLYAVIGGPDAGNYELFEGIALNDRSIQGVFSVADESLFQFGFLGGSDPSKLYVAPAAPKPAEAPLVSATGAADGTTTTAATIGLTGGSASAGASGSAGGSVSVGQVTLSAATSATTSALAKFGVTGATVSAQVTAAVEVRLQAGPAFVSYNAEAEASGTAKFSLSTKPSLTITGLATAQASQTGGVGGDLGGGVSGQTSATATAFAEARNTTALGIVDGALKVGQSVFVGVGASAGISGGISGGGVSGNASVTVYSPGSLAAGASASGGYSNQTVTLGFTLALSIGIGGLEISPSFSFSTAVIEDIGATLFGISRSTCDAACQQSQATAAATNRAREMYRSGGLTMELMNFIKANPNVVSADNTKNPDMEMMVISGGFKSLANTPQDIANAAREGQALLAKMQADPSKITPADMEAAVRLRNKENALVKNAERLGLKLAAVNGQLQLVPIPKAK